MSIGRHRAPEGARGHDRELPAHPRRRGRRRDRCSPRVADVRVAMDLSPRWACLTPDGETEIDATGALVTPGFIDPHGHTHPQCSGIRNYPDSLHGVTTMLAGNCSLSLTDQRGRPRSQVAGPVRLHRGCRVHPSTTHIPCTWDDYAVYRDALHAMGTGINLALPVGHTRSRLAAHAATTPGTRPPPPSKIAAMAELLEQSHGRPAPGVCRRVPRRRKQGASRASRAAERRRVRRGSSTCSCRAGRGDRRDGPQPARRRPPRPRLGDLAVRCENETSPSPGPGCPRGPSSPATPGWIDISRRPRRRRRPPVPPALALNRRLPAQLDSSMMFMSMPEGQPSGIDMNIIEESQLSRKSTVRGESWG